MNGRNFLDLALLTPGVTRDARQGDLSFAGQRGTLNSLVVDGADTNNTFTGQSLGRTGSAAQSGQPYSARVNGDLNGDGNARNDLAPGTQRNSLRLPAIVQLDLRVARDIPLGGRARAQLIADHS